MDDKIRTPDELLPPIATPDDLEAEGATSLWKKISEKAKKPRDLDQKLVDDLKKKANPPPVDTSTSLTKALLGPIGAITEYHFPPELIGGCCPRIVGEEEDIVWNTAAEAVDSERVHLVWSAMGDHIWYLAIRSSELSSHANSWCPLAALLPGMKDAIVMPVIYTYYSDESATMMTLTNDSLQIHRGTSSVVRAKAERVSRELGNASVIDLIPDRIEKLNPMPWYSLSLFEDRARRVLATISIFASLVVAGMALLIWFGATMAMISARTEVTEIQEHAKQKTLDLMKTVQNLRSSPMREQLAKFADVNDGLIALNGFLEIYQVKGGKSLWRAVVPANVTSDRISELGGQTLETSPQGVVVGNSKEALTLGKK